MILPAEQFRLSWPDITCGSLCRSAEHYRRVVEQFQVETTPRYQPANNNTFCNIFVTDATRAMACEVPHWLYGSELSANAVVEWLDGPGHVAGWSQVDHEAATLAAQAGHPVVLAWSNPNPLHHGHVAMGIPSAKLPGTLAIAQAGLRCLYDVPIVDGFGALEPRYFTHA